MFLWEKPTEQIEPLASQQHLGLALVVLPTHRQEELEVGVGEERDGRDAVVAGPLDVSKFVMRPHDVAEDLLEPTTKISS